jgi:acetyltransferase-like isoleucine patch superfamily enzyme
MRSPGHSFLVRPLRDPIGRWLHGRLDTIVRERIRKELATERATRLTVPRIWGPTDRLHVADTAKINDALINTVSGRVSIGHYAFLGHDVALLTGTHDIDRVGLERQIAIPSEGRDIVVEEGAWIASRAIILGPCRIGANAVVAAGTIVNTDIPSGTIVACNSVQHVSRIRSIPALPLSSGPDS